MELVLYLISRETTEIIVYQVQKDIPVILLSPADDKLQVGEGQKLVKDTTILMYCSLSILFFVVLSHNQKLILAKITPTYCFFKLKALFTLILI